MKDPFSMMILAVAATILVAFTITPSTAQPMRELGGLPKERIDLLRLWRLVDVLQVDEAQAAKLFPLWSRHDRHKRGLHQKRKEVEATLKELLGEEAASDESLRRKMDELQAIGVEMSEMKQGFQDELAVLLSLRQRAQLMLFEGRFRRDLRDIVKDFRRLGEGRRSRGRWFAPPGSDLPE